ncbi:MAG TPA: sulfurtransferase [Paracoccus sp.]|nr:sulfurtransferase [Paracoccus sp. (in: a-proteobacteria)]
MMSFLKSLFAGSPRLAPAEAVRMVGDGAAIIADVREDAELRSTGKAKGALHLPLSALPQAGDPGSGRFERKLNPALEAGLPVIVYCASGGRSEQAARVLRAQGFATVHNLGGLRDWVAGGGMVQK